MTSEVRFKELAVEYIIQHPTEFLDVGTFKNHLEAINFPFDQEDLRPIEVNTVAWKQKVGNIICHSSMSTPGVISIKYQEPPPTDPKELAFWKKKQPRYFFTSDSNPLLDAIKIEPGWEILNVNTTLPTNLFEI